VLKQLNGKLVKIQCFPQNSSEVRAHYPLKMKIFGKVEFLPTFKSIFEAWIPAVL